MRAYVWPQLPRLALGGACLVGTNGLGMGIPWLIKRAIDTLAAAGPHGGSAAIAIVQRLALGIVALAVGQAALRTASRVLVFHAGRHVEHTLRREAFSRLLRLPMSFHRGAAVGDLMSRLTNDLSSVRMLLGPGLLNVANTIIVYATGLVLLTRLDLTLTTVALLPLPVLAVCTQVASRAVYRKSRALQEELGTLSTVLQEDLAGLAVVRAYVLEDHRHQAFARANARYLDRAMDLARTRGMLTPLFAIVAGFGTVIVLWLGGRAVISGRMSIGSFVAFNAYLVYLSWPMLALGWVVSLWQRGVAGWGRVRELLAMTGEQTGAQTGDQTPAGSVGRVAIEARGLTVRLDGRVVLDDVSFEVPAGSILAIVGRTGSGKSVLVDALLRFVEVPAGTLWVGGRDVTQIPLPELRATLAYAPQEPFLFSASVLDNVSFGVAQPEAGDAEDGTRGTAIAAAQAAGLTRDLSELPQGIDTVVGERGITLSGGQRQRVALARALFADAPVLLLDDSLSSVDAETERDIVDRLRPAIAGRTTVLVSHRLSAVRRADQILVLDHGRVAERGSHHHLLTLGGVYASLYQEQQARTVAEAGTLEA